MSTDLTAFSPDEQAAYQSALAEYDVFIKRNDAFYAAGATSVAAKDFFQKYAINWAEAWGNLAQVANNGGRISGETTTIWTKPQSINAAAATEVVVLRQCLDTSTLVVTQNGSTVPQPSSGQRHVYVIRLEKRPGEDWWRSGVAREGTSC